MYYSQSARIAVYAEGELGRKSKTAEGMIRYGVNPIVAVVDSTKAGKRVGDVLPLESDIPIVASIEECLPYNPEALLLGTAWSGGRLPDSWRADIIKALHSGMDIINGLHDFLSDDPQISKEANQAGKQLLDVRRSPDNLPTADGRVLKCNSFVVLTVGTDCSVGKMTASLEVVKTARKRKVKTGFVATGQTGIMIWGSGIAIDRVIGDFMAGATEELVLEAARDNDIVLVEGQGSIVHPAFSGVTMSMLHGSCPNAMILCHKSTKTQMTDSHKPIPSVAELIPIYENLAGYMRPARVIAVALNTVGLSDQQARAACAKVSDETGLPCCDPVRHGAEILLDAILTESEKTVATAKTAGA